MRPLRDAFRSLSRAPGLAIAAVVCLALGSAAATAIATLVDVALVRRLPFPDADRLVRVWLDERDVENRLSLSIPEAKELTAISAFDAFSATSRVRAVVLLGDGAERLRGEGVNATYFEMLGVQAAHGRLLTAEDFRPEAPPAIVLSYGTWMRGFGGDASAIGRSLRSERALYTIVGVAPRGFQGTVEPDVVDFWTPLDHYEPLSMITARDVRFTWSIARLAPHATLGSAQSELDALSAAWKATWPDTYRRRTLRVEPFGESWRDAYRRGVGTMAAAGLALLAIAGLNVGCLLVARVLDRRRELAVRAALGADRRRLAILLLYEAGIIVALGGVAGMIVGQRLLDGFLAIAPVSLPWYLDVTPDGRTLTAAIAALVLAGLVAAAVPALIGGRVGPGEVLKEAGRGNAAGSMERRWVGILVASEVALTLTLLVAGGLLLRAYERLAGMEVGYRRAGIARLAITFSRADAGDPASRPALYERIREAVARYPGVRQAGLVAPTLPPWDANRARIRFDGIDPFVSPDGLEVGLHMADEGLLPALGVRLLEGRNLDPSDRSGSAPVAVVSEALAARMGGTARVVGRELEVLAQMAGQPDERFRIVGVASNVAYDGLGEQGTGRYIRYSGTGDARAGRLDVYVSLMRTAVTTISVAAVTSGDPSALIDPLRREIHKVAPTSAVHWTGTMEHEVGLEYAPTRFYAVLAGAFSASALALTSVGLFALLSHAATRRATEMGIRMALGATPRQVAGLLLGTGAGPLLAGAAGGLGGAAWASMGMRTLLYDVRVTDAWAFGGALAALALVALAAGLVPARRVASVDPVRIMKSE